MGKTGDTLKAGLLGGLVGAARTPGGADMLGLLSPAMALLRNKSDKDTEEGRRAAESGMKRGGKVKKMAKGGSASSRADGCVKQGRTKGRFR